MVLAVPVVLADRVSEPQRCPACGAPYAVALLVDVLCGNSACRCYSETHRAGLNWIQHAEIDYHLRAQAGPGS